MRKVQPPENGISAKGSGDCSQNIETVNIKVRLLANLSSYAPQDEDEFTLTVARRETVADFIKRFNIPAQLKPIVIVNGRPSRSTSRFAEGDRVLVYEPVTGG